MATKEGIPCLCLISCPTKPLLPSCFLTPRWLPQRSMRGKGQLQAQVLMEALMALVQAVAGTPAGHSRQIVRRRQTHHEVKTSVGLVQPGSPGASGQCSGVERQERRK